MTRFAFLSLLSFTTAALTACASTPEPIIEEPVAVVVPEVIDTCTPVSALTRVVIPAETQVRYATTEIANPPYEPITRTEKVEREIKPEEIIYVDSEGRQVLDLCDSPTAVTPGQLGGFDDLGDFQVEQIGGPRTLIDKPMIDLDPNK